MVGKEIPISQAEADRIEAARGRLGGFWGRLEGAQDIEAFEKAVAELDEFMNDAKADTAVWKFLGPELCEASSAANTVMLEARMVKKAPGERIRWWREQSLRSGERMRYCVDTGRIDGQL